METRRLILPLMVLWGLQGSVQAEAGGDSRLRFQGTYRLRLRDISSTAVEPVGTYGEVLDEGRTFTHLARVELAADVGPHTTAGFMVRLSNEGKHAFESGPERLADEGGSVYARYSARHISTTMGYYRIHLTPLVLMRWDQEDNPQGGGQSACACPGAGGAITSESLEEMGPDLTLEGIKVEAHWLDRFETMVFLARPRTAVENRSFRQYTYGLSLRTYSYHVPSASLGNLGLAVLWHQDEKRSVARPLAVPYSPRRNAVFAAHLDWPLGRRTRIKAEAATSTEDVNLFSDADPVRHGHGERLVLEFNYPPQLAIDIAYLYLSAEFESVYRAVSYAPDRRGWRLAAQWSWERAAVWTFYKRMRVVEKQDDHSPFWDLSLGGEIELGRGVELESVLMRQRQEEEILSTLSAQLVHQTAPRAELRLSYQYLDLSDRLDRTLDHHTHQFFVLSDISF